jgi:thioredoxin
MVTGSFDELLASTSQPILVDFWAEWCGPCHAVAPTIEQIARDYKGRALVIKVNVDNKPQLAARFSVQSIPTLMILQNGQPIWRQAGVQPYGAIAAELDRATVVTA